jgi:hypothetical protein
MRFDRKCPCFVLYLLIILISSQEKRVESRLFMAQVEAPLGENSIEDKIKGIFGRFVEHIILDYKRKQEKELQMKRNEIFAKYLHSRVSGSVLKDIYSRF